MVKQLEHKEVSFEQQQYQITVVCDELNDSVNAGSLFRLCDALGVKELIFLDLKIEFTPKLKSVSRNTYKVVPYRCLSQAEFLEEIKSEEDVFCLELTSESKSIFERSFDKEKSNFIIIGNEANGVSQSLLDRFESFHIPLYGTNSSMNVVSALGVSLGALLSK